MRPKILLSYESNIQNYRNAVENLGAVAVPGFLAEYDPSYDALILCGGGDADPTYYGEAINGSRRINPDRDKAEFALLDAFVKAEKPIFGICRGMQLINVFFGGSLIQHVDTADKLHYALEGGDFVHKVHAEKGSTICSLYGDSFFVNSRHHQAVKKAGDGLKVTAVSAEDGIVECIEHTSLPIIGTQWHPERMCFANKREDTVDGSLILKYFIDMCCERLK